MLLGNADDVVQVLCHKLGWDLPEPTPVGDGVRLGRDALRRRPRKQRSSESPDLKEPKRVGKRFVPRLAYFRRKTNSAPCSHVWLFNGAEGGKWVEELEVQWSDQQTPPAGKRRTQGEEVSRAGTPSKKVKTS